MTETVQRPPRSWELGTVVLLLAVVAAIAFTLLILVGDLALRHAVQTGGADGISPLLAWMIYHGEGLNTANVLLLFIILRMAVRIAGLTVLLIGIVQIREQVRWAIAQPRPVPVFVPPPPPPVTVPAAAGAAAPVAVEQPVPGSEGLPPADQDFWGPFRDREIAVLERTGAQSFAWRLIPAGGDVSTFRPGAVVTVFTEPLATEPPGRKFQPTAADGYHGLLESAETGAIWYQHVYRWGLPAFLKRAGSGGRWALFPAQDDTPTALVPRQ